MISFPLPEEHRYGRARGSNLVHDGIDNLQESLWLRLWQAKVRNRFPGSGLRPTGIMDVATQKIAIELQHQASLPETGMIDKETWNLAWDTVR